MSFYTSLSGLRGAQTDLSVTSNNIANVGTLGFKRSRASFGDIMPPSPSSAGLGTRVRGIVQQFTPGGYETSARSLDLAITGRGFFMTRDSATGGVTSFTRNGSLGIDTNRYLTDSGGQFVQVTPPGSDVGGVPSLGSATSLQLPTTAGNERATSRIGIDFTLPSTAPVPSVTPFDPANASSYNHQQVTTLYDAGGNAVSASLFFVRQPDVDGRPQWQMNVVADGQTATATPVTLDFGADGNLTSPLGAIQLDAITPTSGAAPFAPQLQIGNATSLATGSFTVRNLTQDGVGIARFADMAIALDGTVSASFSDGSSRVLGRLLVADFTNPAGLKQLGDTRWQASADSGDPLAGIAGVSGFGDIRSGLLERSNVELTEELVALIAAQRNFQANAKAIDAANQLSQTVINLRS